MGLELLFFNVFLWVQVGCTAHCCGGASHGALWRGPGSVYLAHITLGEKEDPFLHNKALDPKYYNI